MRENMEERAERLARYMIGEQATVRAAAARFGVSKSTVHKDISERLPRFNRPLYVRVKAVLDANKAQRHIRGGIATRRKYKGDAADTPPGTSGDAAGYPPETSGASGTLGGGSGKSRG